MFVLWGVIGVGCLAGLQGAAAQQPKVAQNPATAGQAIAASFAALVEEAIPRHYEERDDWGKTKEIVSGLKFEGFDIKRRHKTVKHGVWKHYKVTVVDPQQRLRVGISNLRQLDGNRLRFQLSLETDLDLWARAKVYELGIHIISLEVVGKTTLRLALDCEIGAHVESRDFLPAIVITPQVHDARLDLVDFRIKRVSDARGPLVKELSGGVERLIERKLGGPALTKKLNRSIDKRREQLTLSPGQLVASDWWPLASLPDVQPVVR
jgi:hypothetical protein